MALVHKLKNQFSKDIFSKFPSIFIFMGTTLFLGIYGNHKGTTLTSEFYYSLFMMIISVSIHLFFYKKRLSILYKTIVWVLSFLAVFLCVFVYTQSEFIFFLSTLLLLSFAPFLFRNSSNEDILLFNLVLLSTISFALLSSLILFAGIESIIFTLIYLFNMHFNKLYHYDIAITIFTVLFPLLALSNILKDDFLNTINFKYDNAFLLLIKNILSPIILIYASILYIYFAKIIFLQELPKGELSTIICLFLTIGILLKSLLVGLNNHNKISNFLNKYFIYLMIVPIVFLNIAIYTRVEQYGFTVLRYLLIMCSIWFTYLFLYELIKKSFSIKNALISLFLLSLVTSISPFNAKDISINSQLNRLKTILIKNNMYINNKVIATKEELPTSQKIAISETIKYLVNKDISKNALSKLFDKNISSKEEALKYINVQYTNKYTLLQPKYLKNISLNNIAIRTTGYDYVADLVFNSLKKSMQFGAKSLNYSMQNSILTINIEKQIFKFDLKAIVKELRKDKVEYLDKTNYQKAIFDMENENIKIRLFIKSLFIVEKDSLYDLRINAGKGILLFKIKKKNK
ncbi:DUF4153 domain-containing protein [Arcobacter sp. F2176]|uniref:DUF4153 domain-containing protein n=1 Tax=unclassified Arcobacter TaxID=2593671 RepID=UPI00100B40BC|nr:DUF4153 domain-containing protein [Arcobacter sp. F2176]